jgi:oligopeptide/dipeptide ABC transporter ATP-binding protein
MFSLQMGFSKKQAWEKAVEILKMVHIPSPAQRMKEYPHELSGGMRQRVMIAMALACNPRLLIADEPTTALDVTIQAQILDLMLEIKKKLGMAMMLITHDLGIVANTVERIAVMYAGKIVEEGDVYAIFEDPKHPYTTGLLRAVPRMDHDSESQAKRLFEIKGVVPSLYQLPQGCNFYPRCDRRADRCNTQDPTLVEIKSGHSVSCWLY